MAFEFFKRKSKNMSDSMSIEQNYTFHFNESGILYPYSVQPKTDLDFYWQALEQEGYADLIEQEETGMGDNVGQGSVV